MAQWQAQGSLTGGDADDASSSDEGELEVTPAAPPTSSATPSAETPSEATRPQKVDDSDDDEVPQKFVPAKENALSDIKLKPKHGRSAQGVRVASAQSGRRAAPVYGDETWGKDVAPTDDLADTKLTAYSKAKGKAKGKSRPGEGDDE